MQHLTDLVATNHNSLTCQRYFITFCYTLMKSGVEIIVSMVTATEINECYDVREELLMFCNHWCGVHAINFWSV